VTVGSAYSTGIALAGAGAMLLVGTAAFAAEPASRGWRPDPVRSHGRDNPGRSPGLRRLILVMVALSSVYGAVQVGLAAATSALGSVGSAGPLLAVWGVGSLLGGLIATRLGGGMRTAGGVSLLLAALTAGHASLGAFSTSTLGMAAVLLLAGMSIAPTLGAAAGGSVAASLGPAAAFALAGGAGVRDLASCTIAARHPGRRGRRDLSTNRETFERGRARG
jgi:hypothetical protein